MDPYLGEIRAFAGAYAPTGWHICDGSSMNVNQYQALFALLGTTYGGDGVNTFNLPNLQMKVAVGTGTISPAGGTGTYTLAQAGGVTQVALSEAQIPSHTHSLNAAAIPATTGSPNNAMYAISAPAPATPPAVPYPSADMYTTLPLPNGGPTAPNITFGNTFIGVSGSGAAHNNVMPYMCISYIIALNGIFPQPS